MDVVQDDDQRSFARERLEQPAEAPGDLLRRGDALTERRAESIRSELGVAVLAEGRSQVADLRGDLRERPVGDPLPVGEAAADQNACLGALDELARETRLADPGRADDGCELRRARLDRTRERALQRLELVLPANEGRRDRAGRCPESVEGPLRRREVHPRTGRSCPNRQRSWPENVGDS